MKTYKYIGTFISTEGNSYQLECNCNGYLEAFFLLTAHAIQLDRHYQLSTIRDVELDSVIRVDSILKCISLLNV